MRKQGSITRLSPFEIAIDPTTYKFAKTWQELLEEARESLEKANKLMNKYANKGIRSLNF